MNPKFKVINFLYSTIMEDSSQWRNWIRAAGCLVVFLFQNLNAFSQDFSQLHISELMASNSASIEDIDGDFSDWIELYNPTAEDIDLEGWYMSDNPENLIKWILPKVTIEANGFLMIFASGKDLRFSELHTNFSLSSSGEWVLLTRPDGKTVHFLMQFPVQYSDVSYGYFDEHLIYFNPSTPGTANIIGDFLSPPTFSVPHGLYDNSINLDINSVHQDVTILYTLDGSIPDLNNGTIYTEPILVDSTTIVRAAVTKSGTTSPVTTSSYIFPSKVRNQPEQPEGYPSHWGSFSNEPGYAPADYGMDPDVFDHPSYKDELVSALMSIPAISLSTNKDNLFSLSPDPETGGIYIFTGESSEGMGKGWERPFSVEYILPDGIDGFQVDCGVRIHGGASRLPEKNPKHSFRLIFRDEYGPKKLNFDLFGESATSSFNTIVLRAGFNQTWLHWDNTQRERAQYINDSWAKDIYRKMGNNAAHNKFVHLYLNGMYWGLYNISERMDDDFMDYYLEGGKEDFDVIKDYAEVAEGNSVAWDAMMQLAGAGLSDAWSYNIIQGKDEFGNDDPDGIAYLDVDNLIDFMILNFYAGNKDWDHHNWVAARNRHDPGKGFQFFPWDSERIFNGKNDNIVDENNENRPSFLYSQLRQNPVFRNRFKSRANELLGPGGMLSPDSVIEVWDKRANEIELAVIAESARWGDYRRDNHPYKNDPYELYTKNTHWLNEQDRLMNDYFPKRSQIVLDQLVEIGLAGDIITDIEDELYSGYKINYKSFPNPFDKTVTIHYQGWLDEKVVIDIYNKEGKQVAQPFNDILNTKLLQVIWKPDDLDAGLYFYRITSAENVLTGKLVYVR